jgi:predicted metal-dependent phosphoesterase TrpH
MPVGERSSNRQSYAEERLLGALPGHVLDSFTMAQVQAIRAAIRHDAPSRHWVDYRASIPWLGRSFYLVILAGKERRSADRVLREGQKAFRKVGGAYIVAVLLLLIGMAVTGWISVASVRCFLDGGVRAQLVPTKPP